MENIINSLLKTPVLFIYLSGLLRLIEFSNLIMQTEEEIKKKQKPERDDNKISSKQV